MNIMSEPTKETGFFSMVKSILGALFGIQTRQNQEKDFQKRKPTDFIIAGIIAIFILLIAMILIVHSVLS